MKLEVFAIITLIEQSDIVTPHVHVQVIMNLQHKYSFQEILNIAIHNAKSLTILN